MKNALNKRQAFIGMVFLLLAFAFVGHAAAVVIAGGSFVYGDFGSGGIWKFDGNTWNQITRSNPESIAVSGQFVYGDFGSGGIWKFDGADWGKITSSNPESIVALGQFVYGDFGSGGIWKFDGADWGKITSSNPESIIASDSFLYGDFGSGTYGGIWVYNGNEWTQITPSNPESIIASGQFVYGDFGSGGIWMYDGNEWSQITRSNPESIVALGQFVYGDFGSGGIWMYDDSTWTQITRSNPESIVVSGQFVYGDFGSGGIWRYDGKTWNQITQSDPQVLTAVDGTAPTVTGTNPEDGDASVAASSTISVSFSEAMDRGSVEAAFSSVPPLPSGTFSWKGTTLTFTPDTNLDEATQYSVTVGAGAKDLAGNSLTGPYTWTWRTPLLYRAINLQSDFVGSSSPNGVIPSRDGKYIFWGDGTVGEGSGCDVHLYRVKISDLSSQTIWTNRSFWNIYDDGVNAWVGNYYPYGAVKIPHSSPFDFVVNAVPGGHTISLNGNNLDFANVYFGTSSSVGIGYWNRSTNATGVIAGSSANVYQSAVIGNKVYFPRGSTMNSSGIMVVDAVNNPTALETTLLAGDSQIANANDIYTDGTYLYIHNYTTNQIQKINPSGSGSIEATFSPGVPLTNAAIVGDYIYGGVSQSKNIYVVDKVTGSHVVRDCSAYLPTAVGTPRWDYYNDGIWYGPTSSAKIAYFIPRSDINSACPAVE